MKFFAVAAVALLVAACTRAPAQPAARPDPADATVTVPPVRYGSALGTYAAQRPVDPAPWREQNERVTPRPKQ